MELNIEYAHIVKSVAFCAAAFAMSVGSIGPALAQGMIGKEACNAIGKSPENYSKIRTMMLISMVVVESCAIYNLIISIMILVFVK